MTLGKFVLQRTPLAVFRDMVRGILLSWYVIANYYIIICLSRNDFVEIVTQSTVLVP